MSLTAKLRAGIAWVLTGTPEFGNESSKNESPGFGDTLLSHGTGENQADLIFRDRRTLNASASETLDLSGSLQTPLGLACVFVEVVAIIVKAAVANVNNVVMGGASSNAFVGPFGAANDTIAVPPGGVAMLTAPKGGWAVTPTTADLLQVANSGAGSPVTYDIVIVGRSA